MTDHSQRIQKARVSYDKARTALFQAIQEALADNVGPSQIARDSGFTREYVAKIRDGKGPKGV
ncbi:hypothetical protein [Streptomyces sp. NPDC051994]|uniref:hypothetical protein n=1 Tax=unclassified Streptomyces TaxID=2593676 RepID=UPI0034189C7F